MTIAHQQFLEHYAKTIGIVLHTTATQAQTNISEAVQSTESYQADLSQIRIQALECDACTLCETRQQVVFGTGNPKADLMIIGEAPNPDEEKQGEIFVGRTGQLFNHMLQAMQLSREQIYMSNIVLCRPPENRHPHEDEMEKCRYWLEAQWQAIQPKVVCLLGKVALQSVLGQTATLTEMRGQWFEHLNSKVMVSYHPAYLLRAPSKKALAWQDMQMLQQTLAKLTSQP